MRRLDKKGRSTLQEKDTSKSLAGKIQPGSGNLPNRYLKEDVISEAFLVQCKYTDRKSYSLKKQEIDTTIDRALSLLKTALWRVDIDGTDLAILRWEDAVQIFTDAGMTPE